MRMLRWSCGRSLWDRIPNSVFRSELEVAPFSAKVREGRLRWFGHVRRRLAEAPVRRVERLAVVGARRRGRPRRSWEEQLKMDLKALDLNETMIADRCSWRRRIRVVDSLLGCGSVIESLRVTGSLAHVISVRDFPGGWSAPSKEFHRPTQIGKPHVENAMGPGMSLPISVSFPLYSTHSMYVEHSAEGLHGNSLPAIKVGVWSAYILPSPDPALSGIYWYVYPEDAEDAKYYMDGQVLLGRELTVVFAEENRKKPHEMRARGRSYDRKQSSERYRRSYSRSPDYSPSPRARGRGHSRSISPGGRRYRERSPSRTPYGSRSPSRSPVSSRSPSRSRSRSVEPY